MFETVLLQLAEAGFFEEQSRKCLAQIPFFTDYVDNVIKFCRDQTTDREFKKRIREEKNFYHEREAYNFTFFMSSN